MGAVSLVTEGVDGEVFRPTPRVLEELFFKKDCVMDTYPLKQRLDDAIKAIVLLSASTQISVIDSLFSEMRAWAMSMLDNTKSDEFVAYLKEQLPPEMHERLGNKVFFQEIVDGVSAAFSEYISARADHFRQSLQQTNGLGV